VSSVEQLSQRYAAAVDARDWDAGAALFTEDGVLVVPDPPEHLGPVHESHGRAEIRAALAELEATDRTHHEVTGADPQGRVACVAHHVIGERCIDWHLHYDDEYRETPDGWLIARRELHIDRIEIHPAE
jgi:ketosteroid isomerase-like protein